MPTSLSGPDAAGQEAARPRPELRFAFGANWTRFARGLEETQVERAAASLRALLARERLDELRLVDIGCGSGLFSLAARRLGARVHSFDFDPESVRCTAALRAAYEGDGPTWAVEQGSVLDAAYLDRLGTFDVVYAWGVLHHTGALQDAMAKAALPVKPGGFLVVALYNDQGWRSRYWLAVKRAWQRGRLARALILALHAPPLVAGRGLVRALRRRPLERGMALWADLLDWLGGYPFEVARPSDVVEFYEARGLRLVRSSLVGSRSGCNEFVFQRGGGSA